MNSIMTASASDLQVAIEQAVAKQLSAIDLNAIFDHWSPDRCPPNLLVYLAVALNVDEWSDNYPDSTKRDLLRGAIGRHYQRGTIASLRDFLAAFDIGDFDLIEDTQGVNVSPGIIIRVNQPIANATAAMVFDQVARYLPARCYITRVDFTSAAHSYGGFYLLQRRI